MEIRVEAGGPAFSAEMDKGCEIKALVPKFPLTGRRRKTSLDNLIPRFFGPPSNQRFPQFFSMNLLCLYALETGNPPWIAGIIY